MTEHRATLILAVRIAVDIVHGRVNALEAAGQITRLNSNVWEELAPFEYLDDYRQMGEDPETLAERVLDQAWRLIQDAPV